MVAVRIAQTHTSFGVALQTPLALSFDVRSRRARVCKCLPDFSAMQSHNHEGPRYIFKRELRRAQPCAPRNRRCKEGSFARHRLSSCNMPWPKGSPVSSSTSDANTSTFGGAKPQPSPSKGRRGKGGKGLQESHLGPEDGGPKKETQGPSTTSKRLLHQDPDHASWKHHSTKTKPNPTKTGPNDGPNRPKGKSMGFPKHPILQKGLRRLGYHERIPSKGNKWALSTEWCLPKGPSGHFQWKDLGSLASHTPLPTSHQAREGRRHLVPLLGAESAQRPAQGIKLALRRISPRQGGRL